MPAPKTLAIIGAGKLGIVLTQLAIKAGYSVYIAGSADTAKIMLTIKVLTPCAIATTVDDAINHADIVILALPLGKYRSLSADLLSGKLVIDAMNYWWEVDGKDGEFSSPTISSSEIIQHFLSNSRVVKALSHMGYHHLHDEARQAGQTGRKAIAIAGDSDSDNQTVATLVNTFGFDPVIIGSLSRGVILEPGHELFGANVDEATLQFIVDKSIT